MEKNEKASLEDLTANPGAAIGFGIAFLGIILLLVSKVLFFH